MESFILSSLQKYKKRLVGLFFSLIASVGASYMEAGTQEWFADEPGFLFFPCLIRAVAHPKKLNPSSTFQQTHDLGFPSGQ